MRPLSLSLFLSASIQLAAIGLAATPQETEFFEKHIRPVLAEQCYKCHGPEKQKAELRVDSRAALLKGSDNGPVVVPGKPEQGSFIKSIRHEGDVEKMPAKADKLSDEQIAALTEWVKMGLPWPEGEAHKPTAVEVAAKTHWSFQPVKKPQVPAVPSDKFKPRSPIDAFVLAKLEAANLPPSKPASKRALIRRATFDLTGLPPTPEEIAAFENDSSPDAFAKVIDRLLASPRYGERWGRYWLDVARYADTKGYLAGGEERHFPFSFTYRDWVIKAFNSDMPYDQFLIRQIAADHLQQSGEDVAALGFLTLGRRFINNNFDIIDDRIDVLCRGTMGLTAVCARCHDHKFDPISQKDYYALFGVFNSSTEPSPEDLPRLSANEPLDADYVKTRGEKEARVRDFFLQRGGELACLTAQFQGVAAFVPPEVIESLEKTGYFTRRAKDDLRKLLNEVVRVEMGPNAPARAMALVDKAQPGNARVLIRGNPGRPGEEVPRRFLTVLSNGNPQPFSKGSGRLELAQAVASKDNPLTARVFVNRVWAHHFGFGIVRTPGDFGVKGEPPTHPELLDWLASEFMENGWSVKKLHRTIMLSSTYQQASDATAEGMQRDPENRLLWHMNRQRLDFEALHDSLLQVAGELDLKMGGRPVEITGDKPALRRAVYAFIDRQNLPGVFRSFDFANPDTTNPQRHVTTVPQQALFMMNSPFITDRARALVAKPDFAKPEASEWQVQDLYQRVFSRRAEQSEVDAALKFVSAQLAQPREQEPVPAWQYGWGSFDATAKKVTFNKLPHFTKYAWQAGPKLPDPKLGFVLLNNAGGHPGRDPQHAAIRRWTAPADGVVSISGLLERPSKDGDGVVGRIVSSRSGELLNVTAPPAGKVEAKLDRVEVKRGDTLDFLVECRDADTSDGFHWIPVLRGEIGEWNAQAQFGGPPPPRPVPLNAWEKYAQVLLATNEFVFVD